MRHLRRNPEPPEYLRSAKPRAARNQMLRFWSQEATRRSQTSVPDFFLSADDYALIEPLAEMSSGRCAFCEAHDRLLIHRLRPPSNALPFGKRDPHLYYLWLADAWQNLYPICPGCLPVEPQFPVTGQRCPLPSVEEVERYVERGTGFWPAYPPPEKTLLLDPCIERSFDAHLAPKLDGELTGRSRKGEVTVLMFDLNRPDRRDQRADTYQDRLSTLSRADLKPGGPRTHGKTCSPSIPCHSADLGTSCFAESHAK